MATRRVPLNETAYVTLSGAGGGTAFAGPLTALEAWYPQEVSVRVTQTLPVLNAQCLIYTGKTATEENFRDGTVNGSTGDATDKVKGKLPKGEFVFAVWSGGDAGQRAVMSVTGEREIVVAD